MGIKLPRKIDKDAERQGMGFDILNGKYLVKVVKCETKVPANKTEKDKYLSVELEIVDAAKDKCASAIGFRIFETFSFSEKAQFRLENFLDACYPPKFGGEEIPDNIANPPSWLIVDTRIEEYEGFERPRCRNFNPAVNWKGVDLQLDAEGKEVDSADKKTDTSKSATKQTSGSEEVEM